MPDVSGGGDAMTGSVRSREGSPSHGSRRVARQVSGGMHAHLSCGAEMAQDALDDILLVDERNDAHFP
jgi:hypothetical protein